MEQELFARAPIPRAYFKMALPVVLSMLVSLVYNMVDTWFIAQTQNTALVAGVSLCAPMFTLMVAMGDIFGLGGSSLISRLLGQGEENRVRHVSAFCSYGAIVWGVLVGALMLIFRQPILRLLGASSDTMESAMDYYSYLALGAPAIIFTLVPSNILRTEGMAVASMVGSIIGAVVNIILDPIFIFTFRLGAAGAAIATILGYLFTNCYCLVIVLKKSKVLSVRPKEWKAPRKETAQVFTIGIAAALSNIMSSFSTVLTNQCLLPYGSDKIAAMGIVQKVSMVVMLVITGFSFGGAPLVGFYYGRKDWRMFKKLLRFAAAFLAGLAVLLSAIVALAAPLAVRAFLQGELADTAAVMLRLQVAGMVFMAAVLLCQILFQSTGKSAQALILALSRQGVVFAAVILIGKSLFGYSGIIAAQPAADFLSAIAAVILAAACLRKELHMVPDND